VEVVEQAGATGSFEGIGGRLAATVMATLNRDMELAAIEELDPRPDHRVLSIGFGAGVGLAELARQLPGGCAVGIDPSKTMVEVAARRNRAAIGRGLVELRRAGAEAIPGPDRAFDGVLAVNSAQLWRPLEAGVDEVARVLRRGGALVTMTHVWAIEKQAPVGRWRQALIEILVARRFGSIRSRTQPFRSGRGLVVTARAVSRS
jgi:arsenite methyltransferase